jgi:putative ABC transport system ATP-binding protein
MTAGTDTESDNADTAISVEGLTRTYGTGETLVRAVHDVDFGIPAGEFVVLLGPSGSGKTTMLNMIGAIEEPTAGSLRVDGVELVGLDRVGRTSFRRQKVGFVFQFYNLVPTLTALENVQLVAELTSRSDAGKRSAAQLERVGLGDRLDHFPGQLSGGEQQRVAIARALVKDPPVLLCDEPTGSLDLETGQLVLELLRGVCDQGRTVLTVTHNSTIARMADRVLRLRDGELVGIEQQQHPAAASELEW